MFWRRTTKQQTAFIAFGLGNPGIEYSATRHNVGFWVVDELGRRGKTTHSGHSHHGQVEYCRLDGVDCALVKPSTFMNLSGRCVAAWLRANPGTQFVVVYDDISLPPGALRLRRKGSAGGHRGVQSIIELLGRDDFDRIKLGVGAPPTGIDAADYVLSKPRPQEEDLIMASVPRAADAVLALACGDFDRAGQLLANGDGK